MDQSDIDQRAVDQALLAEQRHPGNHADDVRGPERHGADQEQADRDQRVADMEDQEIGDKKPMSSVKNQVRTVNLIDRQDRGR